MMQQISWRIPFVSESLAAIHPKNSLLTPNHRFILHAFCLLLRLIEHHSPQRNIYLLALSRKNTQKLVQHCDYDDVLSSNLNLFLPTLVVPFVFFGVAHNCSAVVLLH
jgi:hypothetical protein